ncbi:SCO4225 family membrane protein [Actinokineospora xionganensis]|uniref:Uncharacterized protein n=1 Tax=Actinokineospora xionganensis TaxID=2684470 RepID=A0ABR7LAM6_9PSEU|nr:hypothetical protein [Actinokineospora xionganensis]MBC6449743.1 hypothetical protein [Actinokineospora xionganensis]
MSKATVAALAYLAFVAAVCAVTVVVAAVGDSESMVGVWCVFVTAPVSLLVVQAASAIGYWPVVIISALAQAVLIWVVVRVVTSRSAGASR